MVTIRCKIILYIGTCITLKLVQLVLLGCVVLFIFTNFLEDKWTAAIFYISLGFILMALGTKAVLLFNGWNFYCRLNRRKDVFLYEMIYFAYLFFFLLMILVMVLVNLYLIDKDSILLSTNEVYNKSTVLATKKIKENNDIISPNSKSKENNNSTPSFTNKTEENKSLIRATNNTVENNSTISATYKVAENANSTISATDKIEDIEINKNQSSNSWQYISSICPNFDEQHPINDLIANDSNHSNSNGSTFNTPPIKYVKDSYFSSLLIQLLILFSTLLAQTIIVVLLYFHNKLINSLPVEEPMIEHIPIEVLQPNQVNEE